MKIVKALRDVFDDALPLIETLEMEVRDILKPPVEEREWWFFGRVKELQSFALKVETGRVKDPSKLEDFYACTIVVPTMAEVTKAETLVEGLFQVKRRRPRDNKVTHKKASSFVFDDLRLYVSRKPSPSGLHSNLDGVVFEVQIKTFLQHAWGIATHDLIYKSKSASWSKERIAYQVKAMLEHAEVAIAEADSLANASAVSKSDNSTIEIQNLIGQINQIWKEEWLPRNVKRLAETFSELLHAADIEPLLFTQIIDDERERFGLLPTELSPYAFFLQALAHSKLKNFRKMFNRNSIKTRIFIHSNMDLPDWMKRKHKRIINVD